MDHPPDATAFEQIARRRFSELEGSDLTSMGVVFNLVRVANQMVADFETTVHRPLGLSWAGFRVLFTVLAAGPIEPRQLAKLTNVTRASISAVLNTLEREGLAKRERSSRDRRVVTIVLTPKGETAIDKALRVHHEHEKEWASVLSRSEQQTLSSLLRRLAQRPTPALDDGDEPEDDLAG